MDFEGAKTYIINRLSNEINQAVTYHNIDHTLDVYYAVIRIAEKENIGKEDLNLLKTAALFHDSGMLKTYDGHEEASVELIKKVLPDLGYSSGKIETIGRIIMSTKLPQDAKTTAEKILCDADLDYLGRDDFFTISHALRLEWERLGLKRISLLDWYISQVEFLSEHRYFTKTSVEVREKGKKSNLRLINELLNHNE